MGQKILDIRTDSSSSNNISFYPLPYATTARVQNARVKHNNYKPESETAIKKEGYCGGTQIVSSANTFLLSDDRQTPVWGRGAEATSEPGFGVS